MVHTDICIFVSLPLYLNLCLSPSVSLSLSLPLCLSLGSSRKNPLNLVLEIRLIKCMETTLADKPTPSNPDPVTNKSKRRSSWGLSRAGFVLGFVSHKKTLTTVSIPTVQEVLSKFFLEIWKWDSILGHPEGDRHATENKLIYSLIRAHKYPGRDTLLYMNLVNTTNQLVAKTFIDIISVADPDPFFNKQGQK